MLLTKEVLYSQNNFIFTDVTRSQWFPFVVNNGPWQTCSPGKCLSHILNTQLVPLPNNHHLPEIQKIEIYQDTQ